MLVVWSAEKRDKCPPPHTHTRSSLYVKGDYEEKNMQEMYLYGGMFVQSLVQLTYVAFMQLLLLHTTYVF